MSKQEAPSKLMNRAREALKTISRYRLRFLARDTLKLSHGELCNIQSAEIIERVLQLLCPEDICRLIEYIEQESSEKAAASTERVLQQNAELKADRDFLIEIVSAAISRGAIKIVA